jgi:acid phosphatase type 7
VSRSVRCLLATAIALLALCSPAFGVVRAAFYEPITADAWLQTDPPYSHYIPSLGAYDSGVGSIVRQQLAWMEYANLDAAIASWDGTGTPSDSRLPGIFNASVTSPIKWSLYYEPEYATDPSVQDISTVLEYINARYASQPPYLRINGRPVLFVHGGAADTCDMADRWQQANTLNFYLVLTVVPDYTGCTSQPDAWHQYDPGVAESRVPGQSYSISPGEWSGDAAEPQLTRSWPNWRDAIRQMIASNEPLQLITTWNDWADGSAVEGATDWVHPICLATPIPCTGTYLNLLHKHITSVEVAAAGDIACDPSSANFNGGVGTDGFCHQKYTSDLLTGVEGVLALGDLQYETGSANKFLQSYDQSWGPFKPITYPVPGNHEYSTPGAAGYFDYFGARAGDPTRGYYSFDLGAWHLIALNSNCSMVSCAAGSEQETWLQADLAANSAKQCTLAFWHQAHFTDGPHTADDDGSTGAFWDDLYAAGAELVLNGHDHNYQRYPPLKPDGTRDDAAGVREIIVGTGGKDYDSTPIPNVGGPVVERSHGGTFGVLKLWLYEDGYDFHFVWEKDTPSKWSDYGSTKCH